MPEIIHKEYRPVNLMRPTTVFVEVPNIVFYADAQVIARLMIVSEQDHDIRNAFGAMYQKFRNKTFTDIYTDLEETKSSSNILLEYANWGYLMKDVDDGDVIQYCNRVYDAMLYFTGKLEVPFVATTLGNAIRVIAKDPNLSKLYLYMKHPSKEITSEVERLFWTSGGVAEWVTNGDIRTAIASANADVYFLCDFQSIEGIFSIPTIKHREVLLPAYPFNWNMYSPLIKKDSIQSEVDLYSKFDIDINFVKTPI